MNIKKLRYKLEIVENVKEDIDDLSEEEVELLKSEITTAVTHWLSVGGFNLAEPISLDFELED